MESAPDRSTREDRVKLRRAALIEFEIERAPTAPNRTIALACRTSSATVAAVRGKLERASATSPDLDASGVA